MLYAPPKEVMSDVGDLDFRVACPYASRVWMEDS